MILLFVVISLLLIWRTSFKINKIEKERKFALQNFRSAVESAPYGMIVSDKKGVIKLVNHQAEKMYGYNAGELIGLSLKQLIPEEYHEDFISKNKLFFSSPAVSNLGIDDTIYARRKDGKSFPVEIVLTPIKSEEGVLVLASINDVTKRKKQEEIITKQLSELQFKNQELEQFNYIASHDLQEPLRTLSNYIGMLREDYAEDCGGELLEHMNVMDSATSRMSHLVQSLLDFGKLGRNKKLTLTDCNIVASNVIADLGSLIKKNAAEVQIVGELPTIYAYETELRQLFQNLVTNALKFRKENTTPFVKISSVERNGFYEFSVADNGIGIAPKHYDHIFHIFQRINSEEEFEGHGIGLANCKKIAEMHGGKIWVESEYGKGSTFIFTILNLKSKSNIK
jgi:PAS domain S-box-containing protein